MLKRRFREFFLSPCSARPLAMLRIAIAGALLIEAWHVLPYLNELYGPYGILQADLIEALTGTAVPGLLAKLGVGPSTYQTIFQLFYAVHIAFSLALLLGYRTRVAAVGVWLTQAVLLNSGYLSSYGVDRYFLNLSFMMVWMPIGDVWSIDAWLADPPPQPKASARLALRALQIFILMTYIDAGVSKSMGTDWWDGEAIWRVLNQPEFRRYDFLWLSHIPHVVRAIGLGTMFIEAFYFIGFWIPRIGCLWALAIIGMHLGIALTMGLSLFGVTLAAVNFALFIVPSLEPNPRLARAWRPLERARRRPVLAPVLRTSER